MANVILCAPLLTSPQQPNTVSAVECPASRLGTSTSPTSRLSSDAPARAHRAGGKEIRESNSSLHRRVPRRHDLVVGAGQLRCQRVLVRRSCCFAVVQRSESCKAAPQQRAMYFVVAAMEVHQRVTGMIEGVMALNPYGWHRVREELLTHPLGGDSILFKCMDTLGPCPASASRVITLDALNTQDTSGPCPALGAYELGPYRGYMPSSLSRSLMLCCEEDIHRKKM